MPTKKIYFADLTHTAQGMSSPSFPLGISFVVSYAQQQLGNEFEFELFKFPKDLDEALNKEIPSVMCFSNYAWNLQLAYAFAARAKACKKDLITVFGGPNFPTENKEKIDFLYNKPDIDFYIALEGELGFVDLITQLMARDFSVSKLKEKREKILNTEYLVNHELISGPIERIQDVNIIPSPYLTGVMDKFFDQTLIPMIETTRGCPFSCTYCADGLKIKNKIYRFNIQRTKKELEYIGSNVKGIDELVITDLNFAMYKEDLETAKIIAEIQKKYDYPILISASAGKNKPQMVIDVAKILNGTWTVGASVQSTDPEVLKAIKRSNISSEAYRQLIEYGNSLRDSKTHTEIILGLPEDTKKKHFECIRFGIDNDVNNVRMYQAMLLVGTFMASQKAREKYGLITKFRIIPGCIGNYKILGQECPVAEIEEIIIGNNTMPVEDYVDCRIMNLMVETFYGNAIFEEVFAMVQTLGVSPFDCLLYLKEHSEFYSSRVKDIISEYVKQTTEDLYDSFETAHNHVIRPEIMDQYLNGRLGTNELLVHRALLFSEFEGICRLLFQAVKLTLKQRQLWNEKVDTYLAELEIFIVMRKKDVFVLSENIMKKTFQYDFEAVSEAKYKINPNVFPMMSEPQEFRFFHDEHQKQHISNQIKMYADTPSGLGRLIQRSNLKLMYRIFEKVGCTVSA